MKHHESFSKIGGLLFDKDGTLFSYDTSWLVVNKELAMIAARGDHTFAEKILSACGMDLNTGSVIPDTLLASGTINEIALAMIEAGSTVKFVDMIKAFKDVIVRSVYVSKQITNLKVFFSRLQQRGFLLGIASNDSEDSIIKTAEHFEFLEYLNYISGCDSGYGCKPDIGMALGFCSATGLEPSQIAIIGDSNRDMDMAQSVGAGLKVAVLTGTGTHSSLSEKSDLCIKDITVLEALLPSFI
ncbi:Hydrolase, haloacid dehalogenase-like family [Liberibacter crescens BT-1]|uniref:phosphoglycolate phosphatase n=1 Tax=Liberibacter crescens (strain BT-1) TaxID=1215343 RepID=L0ETE4_LIBCB|nr:HAD family hydrolase [Liberibacter crescens]AGA64227.1 Hydrolase, haloacid dehalogenase-like family [Liberibacter crescens BT-1]AMC13308.1 haloacid dehalogenase [Liberibacter crescens]